MDVKIVASERNTHALLALATRNVFSIWKSWSCICPIMTAGEYTPATVKAAPNIAPEETDFKVLTFILFLLAWSYRLMVFLLIVWDGK